jgi:hypothetical protein
MDKETPTKGEPAHIETRRARHLHPVRASAPSWTPLHSAAQPRQTLRPAPPPVTERWLVGWPDKCGRRLREVIGAEVRTEMTNRRGGGIVWEVLAALHVWRGGKSRLT